MKAVLTSITIMLSAAAANADWCYKFVGYECDPASNTITITYQGAFNEAGRELLKSKGPRKWYLADLTEYVEEEERIGSLKTMERQCELSDGTCTIWFRPVPGNASAQGKCGAWITGSVEVRRGSTTVLPRHQFETRCDDTEAPVITSIVIQAGVREPIIKTATQGEFYRRASQPKVAPSGEGGAGDKTAGVVTEC